MKQELEFLLIIINGDFIYGSIFYYAEWIEGQKKSYLKKIIAKFKKKKNLINNKNY